MNRHRRATGMRSAWTLVLLLALACPRRVTVQSQQQIIDRWLTCDECVNGELDSVRALGASARPALIAALNGPADSVLQNFTGSSGSAFARARRQHERLPEPERVANPLGDSIAFVRRNVENFRALYQLRAARALAVIDGASARESFRRALAEERRGGRPVFRGDVRRLIDSLSRASP